MFIHILIQITQFDVEDCLIDVYYYFDKSTKRKAELAGTKWKKRVINAKIYVLFYSDFSTFCDVTYRDIVHHINVRWLSLQMAADRALQMYPALKSYFLSKGKAMHDCYCYMYVIELYMIWGLLCLPWMHCLESTVRFKRLQSLFENEMVQVYLLFYSHVL